MLLKHLNGKRYMKESIMLLNEIIMRTVLLIISALIVAFSCISCHYKMSEGGSVVPHINRKNATYSVH